MSAAAHSGFTSVADLEPEVAGALGDLLLVLADNKRLLGMRYSDWILGAPTLEAGIACSAMAQDEWGHGRIFYAMLKDFGKDPAELERGRDAEAYRSSELLDSSPSSWADLIALNFLFDTAISVQYQALVASRYEPLHYKVRKLLDEERFHLDHGRGWVARLGATEAGRGALREALAAAWEPTVRWFGPDSDVLGTALHAAGITDAAPAELRARWLGYVAPPLREIGLEFAEPDGEGWRSASPASFEGWDPVRRRTCEPSPGPDETTLVRVRGDRNRALLLD